MGEDIKFVLHEDGCKMFNHPKGCIHVWVVLQCGETELNTGISATGPDSREACLSVLAAKLQRV